MTERTDSHMMVAEPHQSFGGDWTEIKLAMLKDYLAAYLQALKNTDFIKMYVDAFAGTGYRETQTESDTPDMFAEQTEAENAGFFDGSTKLALQIDPPFDRYVFIEKNPRRMKELRVVARDFPAIADRIDFQKGDANEVIPEFCRRTDWQKTRAVLFLDPFGMSVNWTTMEAIAQTKAIDLWILFPVGIGVNRLLKQKPDEMSPAWQSKLDVFFGIPEWRNAFYTTSCQETLFGEEEITSRVPNAIPAIANFYQERLKTLFPKVVSNPRYLCNSKNSPMFLFTFAISNPSQKAQKPALRIAEHILGKTR